MTNAPFAQVCSQVLCRLGQPGVAVLRAALVTTFSIGATFAQPAQAAPARTLILPTVTIGEVRPIQLKRIEKGIADTLSFSGKVTSITDPSPVDPPKSGKVAAPMAVDPHLQRADTLRQDGTDAQLEGKHAVALSKLEAAIAAYRAGYAELVDYTKLADAYARAGVAAYQAGKGAAKAAKHFDAGFILQPTLAIDRRKADKELLALFDGRREALEAAPRQTLRVEGEAEGAEVFVDGVRVGALPAEVPNLAPGEHYLQVRGDAWQTYAKKVAVHRKGLTVKAKMKPVKVEAEVGHGKILSFDDIKHCTEKGEMTTKPCLKLAAAFAKQTATELLLHPVVVADRYGRLTLHGFLQRADGKTLALSPREIDKNLTDLNAPLTELANEVGAAAADFPTARALDRKPKLFR